MGGDGRLADRVDRWFELSARGTTYGREVRGGVVTFVAMAYIIAVNPLILGSAPDVDGQLLGGGTDPAATVPLIAAATALVAGVMTILMGAVGRFPMAIAAGLGLSGFVAYTLAPTMTWPQAMGLVVLEGVIILLLVLTGFRTAVFHSVPEPLKYAIGVGIGLFIALIGLVDAGVVRPGNPVLQLGIDGMITGWPMAVFIAGLLLTIVLVARGTPGALLISIAATTGLAVVVEAVAQVGPRGPDNPTGWQRSAPELPAQWLTTPDLALLGRVDVLGAFTTVGVLAAVVAVFSLVLSDFFDTLGNAFGLGAQAGLLDEKGELPHLTSVLVVDSLAAVAGGAASTSSNTAFVESASGIGEGARTGIASLVTGALFLLAMFVAPVVAAIPNEAATPVLVVVGFWMMAQVRRIDFTDPAYGIPAFLTIAVMPFTYSITNGIGAGMVSYAVVRLAQGRAREVPVVTWLVAAAFVAYFAVYPIEVVAGLR